MRATMASIAPSSKEAGGAHLRMTREPIAASCPDWAMQHCVVAPPVSIAIRGVDH
jgi:hypothetical protein